MNRYLSTLTATQPNCVPPATGPLTYQWYLNGFPVIGQTALTLTTTNPGNYFLVVYNQNKCDSAISNICTVMDCEIDITVQGVCCSDGTTPITLTANATSTCGGIGSYQWTGPGGPFPPGATLFLNPPPQVTSTYTVTVTDANGCQSSASVTILACR